MYTKCFVEGLFLFQLALLYQITKDVHYFYTILDFAYNIILFFDYTVYDMIRYDTIRYGRLTCAQKLMGVASLI